MDSINHTDTSHAEHDHIMLTVAREHATNISQQQKRDYCGQFYDVGLYTNIAGKINVTQCPLSILA